MLLSLLSGGDMRTIVINLLLTLPVIFLALSFHEAAHGFIAYKMGDRTAYNLGRVTLNPLKHLDPFGCLWMLIFGYGWAKPVPINARNFKNPKKGMALTAIAGPIANLILGLIGVILYSVTVYIFEINFFTLILAENQFTHNILIILINFFYIMAMMNFMLMIFNLIPIPPFDGSRFFGLLLPQKLYFEVMRYEMYTLIAVFVISFLCSRFFGFSPSYLLSEMLFSFLSEKIHSLLFLIF